MATKRTPVLRALAAGLIALLVLTAAACGGSDKPSAKASSKSTSTTSKSSKHTEKSSETAASTGSKDESSSGATTTAAPAGGSAAQAPTDPCNLVDNNTINFAFAGKLQIDRGGQGTQAECRWDANGLARGAVTLEIGKSADFDAFLGRAKQVGPKVAAPSDIGDAAQLYLRTADTGASTEGSLIVKVHDHAVALSVRILWPRDERDKNANTDIATKGLLALGKHVASQLK